MAAILAAIALGLMGGALQGRWLQQPPLVVPGQIPDPCQIDTPHFRDTFNQMLDMHRGPPSAWACRHIPH